jgi:hypothetical protein
MNKNQTLIFAIDALHRWQKLRSGFYSIPDPKRLAETDHTALINQPDRYK